MAEKLGIENLKKMVGAAVHMASAFGKAAEDKKFSYMDVLYFIKPLQELAGLPEAFTAGKLEAKDLDAGERKELADYLKSEFQIPQANVEETIGKVIDATLQMIQVYSIFK